MLQKLGKLMTVLWNGYFSQCIMSLGDGCINCIKLPLFLRIFLVVLFFGETWNYNPGSLDRCLHYLLGSSQEGRTAMMADIGDFFFIENDCLIGFLNIVQCRIQERPNPPPPAPPIFRPNWGPKIQKKIIWDQAHPYLRVWMTLSWPLR